MSQSQSQLERQLSYGSSGLPPITKEISLKKNEIIKVNNPKVDNDDKLFEIKFLGFDFPDIPFKKQKNPFARPDEDTRVSTRLFFLLKLDKPYDTILGTKEKWLPFYVSSGNNSEGLAIGNVNPFTGYISIYHHDRISSNLPGNLFELNDLLSSKPYTQLKSDDPTDIFDKNYNNLNTDNLPYAWVLDKYYMYKELLNYAKKNNFFESIKPELFLGLISPTSGWINKCSFNYYYIYYCIQALLDFTNNPQLKKEFGQLTKNSFNDFEDLCDQFVKKYNIEDDTKVAAIETLKTNFSKAILLFKENPIPEEEMKNKGRLCTKDFDILNTQLKNIFVFDKIDSDKFTGPQPTFNGETGSKISGSHTFRINTPELNHIEYQVPIISSRELNDLIGTCNLYGINLNDSFNKNESKNTFIEFYKEILKKNKDVLKKKNEECNIDELRFKNYLDVLSDGFMPSMSDISLELLKQIKTTGKSKRNTLEAENKVQNQAASRIQASYRRMRNRSTFKKKEDAASIIQASYRRMRNRSTLKKKKAASRIQASYRRMRNTLKKKNAATRIQAAYRGARNRSTLNKKIRKMLAQSEKTDKNLSKKTTVVGGYTKTKKNVNILFRKTKHSNKPNKHRKISKNRKENRNKKTKPIKNITKRKNNYIRHIGKSRGRSRTKKKKN